MNKIGDFSDGIIFGAFVSFMFWVGLVQFFIGGHKEEIGRIQVASGQYECKLIEQENKTTKWECKEVIK